MGGGRERERERRLKEARVGGDGAMLTFNPEFLDVSLNGGRLESDAEGGEDEQPDEEHLAGVTLHEATQLVQMPLQFRSQPQRRFIARCFSLTTTTTYFQ